MGVVINKAGETNIFGIVLLPDRDTAARMQLLRNVLPRSPKRIDLPHLALIRGISSRTYKTDKELLGDIDDVLIPVVSGAYLAEVTALDNIHGRVHGESSVLKLHLPEGLEQNRLDIMSRLQQRGYAIEGFEQQAFQPHMMVTLGVPLPKENDFSDYFSTGHKVEFTDYALLRLGVLDGAPATRVVQSTLSRQI